MPLISSIARKWAGFVTRRAVIVLLVAFIVTIIAFIQLQKIAVSTEIGALMPKGANSVQTLNAALEKTGSFASLQIVAQSDSPEQTLAFIERAKRQIDTYDWVQSSQYFEDIDVLEKHKLLLLDHAELLQLEQDINEAYPTLVAQQLAEIFGVEVNFTLRGENLSGNSNTVLDENRVNEINDSVGAAPATQRRFISDDGLTAVLIVWPKPGMESFNASSQMVDDGQAVIDGLTAEQGFRIVDAGVVGRIANTVAQFEAIIGDLKLGLLTAISLITFLIIVSYRSFMAIPVIFIPLTLGIVWTLGITASTIGNLNLITVFLTLILFGLGIDFGIHNFSRYREERQQGAGVGAAIETIMVNTGSASLIAAVTTALSFFALMFTEFRAFTEFGFIAGIGILLTFTAMYTVLPALLVLAEKVGWTPIRSGKYLKQSLKDRQFLDPLIYRRPVIWSMVFLFAVALFFAQQMRFEQNTKNLEAKLSDHITASTKAAKQVLKSSNSRAIIVVETQEEMIVIDRYFKDKIRSDTETPTIKKISSLLDFVPDQTSQVERLEVIRRLEQRANDLQVFDPEKYKASQRYLSIEDLNTADLPIALRRTYLGSDAAPGYLMYVDNAVNMDNSILAKQFYDDVATFNVEGRQYYAASEGFIFVEMIALMKSDALKAVLLVTLTTAIVVFLFLRSLKGTLVVLIPPLFGILITVGIIGAFGPRLSIMNMVILPSLIGISVDNCIHIFHRFEHDGDDSISKIMNTTGRAAVLTTLSTLIGFGGMITASMGGLRSMGVLAIIGFVACLVMTWLLLPILLQFYSKYDGKSIPG